MLTNGNNIIEIDGYTLMPPIRTVNLIQTTGGTISASPLQGYDGEVVTLSNTTNTDYKFNGYNVVGSTLYDNNKFAFDKSDVNVNGNFIYWPEPVGVTINNKVWQSSNLALDDGGEGIVHFDNVSWRNSTDPPTTYNFGTQYYYTYEAAIRIASKVDGWHLPTHTEWNDMFLYVVSQYDRWDAYRLKSTSGWRPGNVPQSEYYGGNGTNSYGFNGKPCGNVTSPTSTSVSSVGNYSYWWCSDKYNSSKAYYTYFIYTNGEATYSNRDIVNYHPLLSVRLVKD